MLCNCYQLVKRTIDQDDWRINSVETYNAFSLDTFIFIFMQGVFNTAYQNFADASYFWQWKYKTYYEGNNTRLISLLFTLRYPWYGCEDERILRGNFVFSRNCVVWNRVGDGEFCPHMSCTQGPGLLSNVQWTECGQPQIFEYEWR